MRKLKIFKELELAMKLNNVKELAKQFKSQSKRGFSLIEILIALIIIIALIGTAVVKGYNAVTTGQVTALSDFISKAEQAYTSLANNPLCEVPTKKSEFRNAVSDSQCRLNTTDHKGDYEFPDKIDNRWNWDIQKSGTNVVLKIYNVDPSRGNQVIKIHPECTYSSNTITCPLGIVPNTQ
jgi:prepilin-type N-terminal cleavage/methylation domain-containing protein